MIRNTLLTSVLTLSWVLYAFPAASDPSPECVAAVQKATAEHTECLLEATADFAIKERAPRLSQRRARCDSRFEKRFRRALKRNGVDNCTNLRASDIVENTHAFVEQAVAASSNAANIPSAVLLLPSVRTDLNFSEASYQGAIRAIPEDWRLKVIENTGMRPEAEWRAELFAQLENGANVILATGVEYADALTEAMAEYPELRVASVPTGPEGVDAERLLILPLDSGGTGGVLAGEAAVVLTEVGHVAFVGGIEAVDGYEADAFVVRVNEIDPDIIVDVTWVGSFGDPVLTRAVTIEAIEAGADVVLAGSDTVTAQVALERGVKSIGWVYDPRDSGSPLGTASSSVRFDIVWGKAVEWVETGSPPSDAEIDPINFWRATIYPH